MLGRTGQIEGGPSLPAAVAKCAPCSSTPQGCGRTENHSWTTTSGPLGKKLAARGSGPLSFPLFHTADGEETMCKSDVVALSGFLRNCSS